MSNEISIINNNFPNQTELQSVGLIAKTAHLSGLYGGIGGEAKIMMILLTAKELGVGPCQALNGGIWSIQGKVEISARLMNGLIRRAGHSIKVIESTDTECILLGTRSDGDSFKCSFTLEDAIKAGLAGSSVWKKYPSDMLYNRCMSRLGRRLFSDVIGNSYIEGEIREAREVEKVEKIHVKNLIQAEFEDTTPKPDSTIHHPHVDIEIHQEPEEPKVNEKQFQEIVEGLGLIDDAALQKLHGHMESHWKVPAGNYKDLPQKAHAVIMIAVRNNVEFNKQKAVGE